jgi:hypothetical protein
MGSNGAFHWRVQYGISQLERCLWTCLRVDSSNLHITSFFYGTRARVVRSKEGTPSTCHPTKNSKMKTMSHQWHNYRDLFQCQSLKVHCRFFLFHPFLALILVWAGRQRVLQMFVYYLKHCPLEIQTTALFQMHCLYWDKLQSPWHLLAKDEWGKCFISMLFFSSISCSLPGRNSSSLAQGYAVPTFLSWASWQRPKAIFTILLHWWYCSVVSGKNRSTYLIYLDKVLVYQKTGKLSMFYKQTFLCNKVDIFVLVYRSLHFNMCMDRFVELHQN